MVEPGAERIKEKVPALAIESVETSSRIVKDSLVGGMEISLS